ncbi:hypothetical protein DS745_09275 [Anaerobacillus alkaliphilus]|uniref:DUF4829 domain-containing protein n=1 Tax=Anaerobacillus alkaliphilus TaxID=1548597 RepID=A0A4Q0VSY2_9BACI|nr:hypothetical protein [Anaerobacillus alkaliphilus]RXJ01662.1 hypothetical protein DS745_09275 [Anaerobacillus alkaliphilus]
MKQGASKIIFFVLAIVIVLLLFLVGKTLFGPSQSDIVKSFYKYEQKMDFTHSYDLFHPLMQDKFSREWYFRQRYHVFFEHFEVDTFQFTVGKGKKLSEWQMSEDSLLLENVYMFTVTKSYNSKRYGNFSLIQDVFVAKDDETGKWKVLWSYK